VHQKVPVSTMKEFVDYVHANPGKLNYGSSGVGSTHHLSMEAVKAALKLDMTHVPFKGTSESVPALLGRPMSRRRFAAYPNLSGRGRHRQRQDARHQQPATLCDGAGRARRSPTFIPGLRFSRRASALYARSGTPPELLCENLGSRG